MSCWSLQKQHTVPRNVIAGIKFWLPRKPRMDAVIVPTVRVTEMLARADLHKYNDGRLAKYLRIQLGSGARIGEVMALRRQDYTPRWTVSLPAS